ncbi:DUF1329 domain-containing protein [Pseudomonas sp. PB101]|uniref:DUF1329 domain-containing protein n=1 Tax=Pseudomonas sp. PB101 TaxID=2495428 RepID=UPI0013657DCD|nr:DUF1329 domain-containing protein [Pseudomonas sp. PB101]MVW84796.1 DUF1329 domain-containing protein [Pseudomonas sp. PB101]
MKLRLCIAATVSFLLATDSFASVPASEAEHLKSTLTPLGGERAGNASGSIPAWTGGMSKTDTQVSGKRSDPFAAEKPLFVITAKNMSQYADKLTPGIQEMLKKYPDSYRLDVYASHRTAAAPQSVYDATYQNALETKLVDSASGPMPENGKAGIPFPIPQAGIEVMWNHLLRWRGESWRVSNTQYLTTADGKHVLASDSHADLQMPWYSADGVRKDGVFWTIRMVNDGPPLRAGEAILGRENLNAENVGAWTYLPGQRRVRRLPNACCDTPTPATAGVMSFDEMGVFSGRLDRFDWKLIGKKEMYIPYNANKVLTAAGPTDILDDHHLKSDVVRWELHRVWVVEATLKSGKRHVMSRSTYYIDEDTWAAVLAERYDAQNALVRVLWTTPVVFPDLPGVVSLTTGFYDLISGAWFAADIFAGKNEQYQIVAPFKDVVFTPDALAGEGVR